MGESKDGTTWLVNFLPNHAKDKRFRSGLENTLKEELIQDVPEMVSRLAKLDQIITCEVEIDFTREAMRAFQFGLWRAVIALVGVVSESLIEKLFSQITTIKLADEKVIQKNELLGERPTVQSKLAFLRLSGIIEENHYRKLLKIWKLRSDYVHPPKKSRDAEKDSFEVMQMLCSVLKERFDKEYTIKQGKIVKKLINT